MSPFYTNEKEKYWKNKMDEMEEVEYFEFEMKKLNTDEGTQKSLRSNNFSIDEKQSNVTQTNILINIKNVS